MSNNNSSVVVKRKIWEKYYNQFNNQLNSMMKAIIGSSIVEISSKNFADDTAVNILSLLRNDPIKVMIKDNKYSYIKPSFDPIHFSLYPLFTIEKEDEKKDDIEHVKEILESLDFKQTNNSQNLIIFCAYFEGFLKQSIENLSKINETVFSKYVQVNKYKQLKILLKISIKANEKEKQNAFDVIKEIFEIRNLYVHHDGIVTNRFIKNTGNNKIHVGEKFPLDSSIILSFYSLLYQSMLSIFITLSQKFFDITVKELKNLSYELK
ncbi:MAG: hypothetical protein ACTSYW_01525 [Candidatus Heimdallarchaeota archaeon]